LFFFLTFLLVHLSINYADSVKSPTAATDSAASAVASESSPADQNLTVEDVAGLLGVLLGLRNLMPLACDASSFAQDSAFQLKGSFGAKVTEKDTHVDVLLVLRVNMLLVFILYFILYFLYYLKMDFRQPDLSYRRFYLVIGTKVKCESSLITSLLKTSYFTLLYLTSLHLFTYLL